MKMDNSKKKELILKNFDIIIDNIQQNAQSIGSAIEKMFKVDINTAVEMWAYILTKHESYIKDESHYITAYLITDCFSILGKREICDIIVNNPTLKHALFSLTSQVWAQADIVEMLIAENDLQLADELLQLLYLNQYKEDSWYEVIDRAMSGLDEDDVSAEAYELLEVWCDKVTNTEERAKLSIRMMEFIE